MLRERAALFGPPRSCDVPAGLHTGECELRDNDLTGLTVHIAARVVGLADPGEVPVTGRCATSSQGPTSSSRVAASTRSRALPASGNYSP